MRKPTRDLAHLCAAAALLGACSIVGPDGREQLGRIQLSPADPPQVTVPASAAVGESFAVTAVTYGGGCLRKGPTRVATRGATAEVRPYDVYVDGQVCPQDVALYEHTATLRFTEPGTATVRILGTGNEPGIITVERTVTITGE